MLINCPECGKNVSEKAETCPYCGVSVSDELRISAGKEILFGNSK